MLRYVLPFALMMTVPLVAQEAPEGLATQIAERARQCWNLLPSDLNEPDNDVVLDLELIAGGEVNGTPEQVSRSNPSVAYSAMVRAAQRAVYACAPYKFKDYEYSGPVRITMIP